MSEPYQPIEDIEEFIRQAFEQNFESLRLESNRSISPDAKQEALNQVLLYWRVLADVAENVTDTEVRLHLPGQESPAGRDYAIEGVVDILRDNDRTVMYDIKTHDAEYVRANLEIYEQQLNVYAHIWQELRKQALDEMAVIATNYPSTVQEALTNSNPQALAHALERWQPVVPIAFKSEHLNNTIRAFGEVVDAIEDGQFGPRSVDDLQTVLTGTDTHGRFATRVCRNCDARFSCASYRRYATGGSKIAERQMQYFTDEPADIEQELWRSANLAAAPEADDLRADFVGA